jgi:chitin disaccharide deacetylase
MDRLTDPVSESVADKCLIIHADDLGMAHSVNEATFGAMEQGAVSSASVMIPCPWAAEVASYLQHNRMLDVGIHITLTSEWDRFKWRPVAPADSVPSLIDCYGYLWRDEESVVKRAEPGDVECEIRAQISLAFQLGLRPTHLDSHMFVLWSTPHLFAVFARVAHEYSLPFLAVKKLHLQSPFVDSLTPNDILVDNVVSIRPYVRPEEWSSWYLNAVGAMARGVTELIVHVGRDDSELRAITHGSDAWGSAWRGRDLTAVTSAAMRNVCGENGIRIVTWKELGTLSRLDLLAQCAIEGQSG